MWTFLKNIFFLFSFQTVYSVITLLHQNVTKQEQNCILLNPIFTDLYVNKISTGPQSILCSNRSVNQKEFKSSFPSSKNHTPPSSLATAGYAFHRLRAETDNFINISCQYIHRTDISDMWTIENVKNVPGTSSFFPGLCSGESCLSIVSLQNAIAS